MVNLFLDALETVGDWFRSFVCSIFNHDALPLLIYRQGDQNFVKCHRCRNLLLVRGTVYQLPGGR